MSTTPQGSALNQDEISLTTLSESEQFIPIDGETDCRRSETFDLPRAKKFKSATNILSNANDLTNMSSSSSNSNGNKPVDTMEHTNGGVNHNGVCRMNSFVDIFENNRKKFYARNQKRRENFIKKSNGVSWFIFEQT